MSQRHRIATTLADARTLLLSSTALFVLAAASPAAFAQATAPTAEAAPAPVIADQPEAAPVAGNGAAATRAADEIVVTGTSIRGIAPTGSNLIAIGRDTITANAPANTSELLATVPQLGNFGANQEQSTSNRFRTAGFQPNIHNLGIYATLTLFNGHRFAPVGGEAVFPDPTIIPVIAIQRVEVIADGASGVYGSDAVAGVVNFIYRRDVDGLETSGTYGFSDDGYRKRDLSAIWGKKWDTGGVMVAYEYSSNTSPTNGDIDFIRLDQRSRGGRDLRTTTCPAANFVIAGQTYAYPSFSSTANRCENGLLNNIIPDGRRHAVLVTAHQDLGENVQVWVEGNYSNYAAHSVNGPRAITVTVPNTNPFFVLPPGVAATSEVVTRSGLGLFPNPENHQSSEVMGITAGIDIKLGGDWRASVMTHYSKTNDYNSDPEVDLLAAQRLANNMTPATAFNPFGQAADNDPMVLAQIDDGYSQINKSHQFLREVQAKFDGPLFKLPGGDVRIALGTDFREDEAKQLQTGGAPGPNLLIVRNDDIDRAVVALFGEASIPVFSQDNALPGFNKLTLSLSGRYDHYQKLGGTFNPKFGLVWEPIRPLSLRASYGKAFAAPNVGMVTSTFGVPQPGSVIAGLGTVNVYNEGGGNPNLTPERARTYSLGGDFKPDFLHGFRFSATYYNVRYSNLLYKPTTNDAFFNPDFADSIIRHPTAAQIAEAIAFAPPQSPVPAQIDYIFRSYTINLGVRKFAGLDLDASYQFHSGFGEFALDANANRQLQYDQQVQPGTPFASRLGTFDAPRWKGRGSVTWSLDPVELSVFMNYTDSFLNTNVTPFQKVGSFTTFDVVASYKFKLLGGVQLQLRAANLFDRDPPFYDGASGYYAALASPFGRTLEATLRAKF